MMIKIVSIFVLVFSLVTTGAEGAERYAVMAASMGRDGVGTAIDSNKSKAIKTAKAQCWRKNTELCTFYVWTKAAYNSIIIKCHVPVGTLTKTGNVLSRAWDKGSLVAARKKAYKRVSGFLLDYGFRADKSNCHDLSSYSRGRFKIY